MMHYNNDAAYCLSAAMYVAQINMPFCVQVTIRLLLLAVQLCLQLQYLPSTLIMKFCEKVCPDPDEHSIMTPLSRDTTGLMENFTLSGTADILSNETSLIIVIGSFVRNLIGDEKFSMFCEKKSFRFNSTVVLEVVSFHARTLVFDVHSNVTCSPGHEYSDVVVDNIPAI